MPLRVLTLDRCPVQDLNPLRDIASREQLVVGRDAPGLAQLRSHPRLAFPAARWDPTTDRPAQTTEDFWTEWDKPRR